MNKVTDEILSKMGFTKIENGKYKHNLMNKEFYFSSPSLEGIIYVVYNKGEQDGINIIQHQIKNIIGIK